MSAFIVEPRTINRLVAFLDEVDRSRKSSGRVCSISRHGISPLYLESPIPFISAESDPNDRFQFAKALATDMFNMNLRAYQDRYADEDTSDVSFEFEEVDVSTESVWALLKSLDCFLYQCSEGSIDQEKLFILLDEFRDKLAGALARATPEYEAAVWE